MNYKCRELSSVLTKYFNDLDEDLALGFGSRSLHK